MSTYIDKLASVDSRAVIADGVHIGPFCVVEADVEIGKGTRLESHVSILGRVKIGKNNRFFQNSVIGGDPQDLSYKGTKTLVTIGDNNTFRESVTVNRGSEKEEGLTSIGNNCYFMNCCHVAHDCCVSDNVIMANGSMLGGHVHVQNNATISGMAGVNQFASIGSFSFVGGVSKVLHDVPPFLLADGIPARPRCVNVVGLKRNDFSKQAIIGLTEAFRLLYRSKVGLNDAREILHNNNLICTPVQALLNFVGNSQLGRHGRSRDRRRKVA